MSKTLFKTIQGIEIFLEEDGRFSASIPGKGKTTRRALSDIEKDISKAGNPVEVYCLYDNPTDLEKVRITGFDKGRARFVSGDLAHVYRRFAILSEADLEKVEEFKKRQEELEALQDKFDEDWRSLIDTFTRVTPQNIEEIRSRQS